MTKPLLAYSVLETGEDTGGIVFARSDIEARKRGSSEWADGDITSVTCRRAHWADAFATVGVIEAREAIAHGWRFECHGCAMTIEEYALNDEGLSVEGVVGTMDSLVFCSIVCKDRHDAAEARKKAFGAVFLDELRAMVRRRFGDVTFTDGEESWRNHVYVRDDDGALCIREASVHFHFPGEQIAPASLVYRHESGRQSIGPPKATFMCRVADQEAFEAFAVSISQETQDV